MLKIDILGSCVTRDSFNYPSEIDFSVNKYFARSSIVSLYGRALKIKLDEINLSSTFQKRMVYFDLTKEFLRYIKNIEADFLIIDFIDERMNVLKTEDSYVTRSREFVNSKLDLRGKILSDADKLMLWERCSARLIEDLSNSVRPEQIILHKAYWKKQFRGKDGEIHDFNNSEISLNNLYLKHYYEIIEKNIKGINVIELEDFIADENHVWGLSPYHYEESYYKEFLKQLSDIVQNIKNA